MITPLDAEEFVYEIVWSIMHNDDSIGFRDRFKGEHKTHGAGRREDICPKEALYCQYVQESNFIAAFQVNMPSQDCHSTKENYFISSYDMYIPSKHLHLQLSLIEVNQTIIAWSYYNPQNRWPFGHRKFAVLTFLVASLQDAKLC